MSCPISDTSKNHLIGCFQSDSTNTTSRGDLPKDQCIAACRTDGFEYSSIKNGVCECSHTFGLNGVAQTCATGDDVNSRQVYANYALYQAGTIDPKQFPSDVIRLDQVESKDDCISRMTRNNKQLMTYIPPDRQHIQIIRATYGANCPVPTSEVVNGQTVSYNADITVELQAKIAGQSVPSIVARLSDILSSSTTGAARLVSQTNRIPDCTGAQLMVTYTCDGGDEITKTVQAGETMTLDCAGQGKCYIFGTTGDLMDTLYNQQNMKDGNSPLVTQPNLFGTNGTEPIYVYPNYTNLTGTDMAKLKSSIQELKTDMDRATTQYTRSDDLLKSFEHGQFNFFSTPCNIQSSMEQVRQEQKAKEPQNVILHNTMSTLGNMVTDYSQRLNQLIQISDSQQVAGVAGEEEELPPSDPSYPSNPIGPMGPMGDVGNISAYISKRDRQIKSSERTETQMDKTIRILKYATYFIAIIFLAVLLTYYTRGS